jgi:hypothetical protein
MEESSGQFWMMDELLMVGEGGEMKTIKARQNQRVMSAYIMQDESMLL